LLCVPPCSFVLSGVRRLIDRDRSPENLVSL
jgi:hypothetical protein